MSKMSLISDVAGLGADKPLDNGGGFDGLLDDSVIRIDDGVEEGMDFNPPGDGINAHAAATGFEKDFTETVVLRDAPETKNRQDPPKKKSNELGATQRDLLSGLGVDEPNN